MSLRILHALARIIGIVHLLLYSLGEAAYNLQRDGGWSKSPSERFHTCAVRGLSTYYSYMKESKTHKDALKAAQEGWCDI